MLDVLDRLAPEKTPIVHHERGDSPLRVARGGMRTLTVTCVPRLANGWMSELEGCAKPILTPLFRAAPLDGLTRSQGRAGHKTAVAFEATRIGRPKFYTLKSARYLR